MTTRWPNRVFCFSLVVTVLNVQNVGLYFCGFPKVDALTARKLIAQQLLETKYNQPVEESPSKRPRHGTTEHHLVSLPTGKNCTRVTRNLQEQIPDLEMLLQACPCADILPVHSRSASLLRLLC